MASARLTKLLKVGDQTINNIVSDNIKLGLFSAGRAKFTLVCDEEPTGLVELQMGYQVKQLTPYFLGVIESKHFAAGRWHLTCRELLGALSFPASIAIRFATVEKVLAQVK